MDKESLDKLTMAFGFKEALDALDRIVEMSTVGGKKQKAEPEEDSDSREFKAAISDVAQMTRYIYEGFTDAGFDDDAIPFATNRGIW